MSKLKWISIDDKLPEDDAWVLVAALSDEEYTVLMGEYSNNGDNEHDLPDWWNIQNWEPLQYDGVITHWMSQPHPPEK